MNWHNMTALERLFMFSAARLGCCVILLGVIAAFWQADLVFGGILLDRSVFLLDLGLTGTRSPGKCITSFR